MSRQNDCKSTPQLGTFSVLKRLARFVKPYMALLTLSTILTVIYITATLASPVVIGYAIDTIVSAGNVDFSQLIFYIIILAILLVVVFSFQWVSSIINNHISYLTIRDIRNASFKKLNDVPIKYIDSHSHGDIMSRLINDADQVSDGLIQGFTQLFSGILTVIGTVFFMFALDVTIALVVVILTPLSLGVAWIIAKLSHNMFRMQAVERGKMSGLCEEFIGNQKIVKAFGYEDNAEEKFQTINTELRKYGTGAMFYSSLVNPVARFINGIVYASVFLLGAMLVVNSNGVFTVGLFSAFLAYANQYTKPFNEITSIVTELQTAFSASRRVFSLLDADEESDDRQNIILANVSGNLKANDVHFAYDKARPLIKGFNINIKSGSKVAIVGPTGCGKTTLINLLMRFYDVDSGSITIDKTNIYDATRRSLRQNYGMVLQESWLFKGTIADNIRYSKPDATDEEIIYACKKAYIHGFISRLKNGYQTVIESDGGNISQGQKQLLCIARIMLSRPPMLILDEATSSIDTRTEKRIQKAFSQIMQGRTSFIIAHRLSTIVDSDMILVMNNGDIIESGSHDELLSQQGFYANLFNSQFSEY